MRFNAHTITRHKWLAIHFFLLALTAVSMGACRDRGPMMGTEEYNKAHGLVEGKTNEIRVKGVLFRFPPEYFPKPYSADKIIKGQADTVTVHLDLSQWFNPPETANSEFLASVRVEIRKDGYEDDKKIEMYFNTRQWKPVHDRPDLGLREYIENRDDGGWGYRTYESIVPGLKTPRGGRIVFDCSGRGGQEPDLCRTGYQHPSGPLIWWYLSGRLLPRWQEVHAEVVKLVNSLIVQ